MRAFCCCAALLLLAVPAAAGQMSKDEVLELAATGMDVDLIASLVKAQCVDFEMDTETLRDLSSRLDKPVIQAIFACKESVAAGTAGRGIVSSPPAQVDSTPRLLREVRARTDGDNGFLELRSDRVLWSHKSKGKPSFEAGFAEVVEFQSYRDESAGKRRDDGRGAVLVRMSDGRAALFDHLGDAGRTYSRSDVELLVHEMNGYVEVYRRLRGLQGTREWRDLTARLRAGKPGTFAFAGSAIAFVPDKEKDRDRFSFRLSYSRVLEVHILESGEAAIRFDRDSPLHDGEHVDLGERDGWIRLADWDGKGIIREFENRGIEPRFSLSG